MLTQSSALAALESNRVNKCFLRYRDARAAVSGWHQVSFGAMNARLRKDSLNRTREVFIDSVANLWYWPNKDKFNNRTGAVRYERTK